MFIENNILTLESLTVVKVHKMTALIFLLNTAFSLQRKVQPIKWPKTLQSVFA